MDVSGTENNSFTNQLNSYFGFSEYRPRLNLLSCAMDPQKICGWISSGSLVDFKKLSDGSPVVFWWIFCGLPDDSSPPPTTPPQISSGSSGQSLHVDLGQFDVVVDVEPDDGSQVGDAVPELQQMRVIDGHPKLFRGAEDLHLERLALHEGEALQVSLLLAPLLADAAVPHDHLLAALIEARVEVESQIIRCIQIHCELVCSGRDGSFNGDQLFVMKSTRKILFVRNCQTLLRGNRKGRSRSRSWSWSR